MFLLALVDTKQEKIKLERVYHKYKYLLFSIAFEILKSNEAAEDAVNETFVKLASCLDKINEDEINKTKNFLAIICKNNALKILEKKVHLNESDIGYDNIEDAESVNFADPQDIIITKDSVKRISSIIENLNPIYRDVIILSSSRKMSYEEIAEHLNISVETVRKRLYRARSIVKEQLKKEELL